MHGDKMAAAHADGTNLTGTGSIALQPYARCLLQASGSDAKRSTNANYRLFQQMHILLQPQRKVLEVQNRITDQLSRTMIRNVSTTVNMIERSPYPAQLFFSQQHIPFFPTTPQCIDMGMLAEHNMIDIALSCLLGMYKCVKPLRLPAPRPGIRNHVPI